MLIGKRLENVDVCKEAYTNHSASTHSDPNTANIWYVWSFSKHYI